jgi:transcriptional regulator with XRE-family HTH domain
VARGIHDSRYRWVVERLVEARKKLGLSQAAVAQRLGKPQQYVSRYETGERRLDIFEYLDAARVLSVDGLAVASEADQQPR